jgi:amino-acid N-acetyltransferase
MSGAAVTLVQVDDETLPYAEGLLARNGLPSRDVRSKADCLYTGYVADEPVGIGGVEVHGSDGLLRSLVVEESARGQGYGAAICEALETRAADQGVETLYLLTTTAAAFFADRGYAEIEREEAPATIQRTTEFDELCPETATCLTKSL